MKNKRKRFSLQSRIIIFHFASSVIVILILVSLLYFSLNHHIVDYVNTKLANKSQLIGHIWIEESSKGPETLVARMDEDLEMSKLHVAVFDTEGKLLYRRKVEYAPNMLDRHEMEMVLNKGGIYRNVKNNGHRHITYLSPFFDGSTHVGYVFLGDPMTFQENQNRIFVFSVIFAVFGMAIPVFLLGKVLGGNISQSIKSLARSTQNVNVDNLEERVKTDSLEPEFVPLAEVFDDMCDRLRVSVDNLKRFTSDASHQLRTPLAVVKGELEATLRKESTREEYIEAISNSLDEMHHLRHIVEGLLFLTRSESNQKVFFMEPMDLRELVAEVAEFAEPLAGSRNIQLTVNLDEPVRMSGDREWLRHLVFNLIDNSIKYCAPFDEINVSLNSNNGTHSLKVSDTGPGIPPEHLPHIFERFYVIPGAKSRDGAGLGLSICKWVAQGHNGRIDVSSRPGEGTSFTTTFNIVS